MQVQCNWLELPVPAIANYQCHCHRRRKNRESILPEGLGNNQMHLKLKMLTQNTSSCITASHVRNNNAKFLPFKVSKALKCFGFQVSSHVFQYHHPPGPFCDLLFRPMHSHGEERYKGNRRHLCAKWLHIWLDLEFEQVHKTNDFAVRFACF